MPDTTDLTPGQERGLVELVKEGNHNAFTIIVERHNNGIVLFARRILRELPDCQDLAKDVAQDVWTNVWEARKNLDSTRRIEPYLFRVTRNVALNVLRANKRIEFGNEAVLNSHPGNFAADIDVRISDAKRKMLRVLQQCSEKNRRLLYRYALHRERIDEDYPDETKAKNAKSELSKAIAQFKEKFKKYDD